MSASPTRPLRPRTWPSHPPPRPGAVAADCPHCGLRGRPLQLQRHSARSPDASIASSPARFSMRPPEHSPRTCPGVTTREAVRPAPVRPVPAGPTALCGSLSLQTGLGSARRAEGTTGERGVWVLRRGPAPALGESGFLLCRQGPVTPPSRPGSQLSSPHYDQPPICPPPGRPVSSCFQGDTRKDTLLSALIISQSYYLLQTCT